MQLNTVKCSGIVGTDHPNNFIKIMSHTARSQLCRRRSRQVSKVWRSEEERERERISSAGLQAKKLMNLKYAAIINAVRVRE